MCDTSYEAKFGDENKRVGVSPEPWIHEGCAYRFVCKGPEKGTAQCIGPACRTYASLAAEERTECALEHIQIVRT